MKAKFGLAALDAIQKNYKIFLDRLIKGYEKITGKQPEGIELTMIKREAYQKAEESAKVVDMEGKTLDASKPIMGGKQMIEESDVVVSKGPRPFGDNIRDAYKKAGRSREDATEMIKALDSPGAKKSYEIMEETLGVRLYGDETFEELMKIKETGVHPRGEPPIKKADGGRINFRLGGPTGREGLQNIIGADLMGPGIGALGGMSPGVGALGGIEEEDEFADIQGQTAGLGVLSFLKATLGPKVGTYVFDRARDKVISKGIDVAQRAAQARRQAAEAAAALVTAQAAVNRRQGTGGYQSDFAQDDDFMSGSGTAAEMGSFARGGLATMFTRKR